MDEELLQQMAMEDMMGGGGMGGMPPMDPMMDPAMAGGTGMTTIEVPDFAVPAVMELVAILEEQIGGAAASGMM
jgi:hypothetical protein